MAYYVNGSLAGKRFSLHELTKYIIPGINEGLYAMHSVNIIHKDIKPSNIMLQDDQHNVAIIDFGISSLEEDGNTVILTRTGMTPEYSAPESRLGLFLEESDYYSFGITLYELYTGYTPYHSLSAEQIAQFSALQKIPFPEDMPQRLRDLIAGLTYHDITNCGDKANPNRRWTYREVKRWLSGEDLPVPGETVTAQKLVPYQFKRQAYSDIAALTDALAADWEEGKRHLFRGLLLGHFKNFNSAVAELCMAAEDSGSPPDVAFFRFLYQLNPQLTALCWMGRRWENLREFGAALKAELQSSAPADSGDIGRMFGWHILSEYASLTLPENDDARDVTQMPETLYLKRHKDEHDRQAVLYAAAFLLSGDRSFKADEQSFTDYASLLTHLDALLTGSQEKYQAFCDKIFRDGAMHPELEGWLIALGKYAPY